MSKFEEWYEKEWGSIPKKEAEIFHYKDLKDAFHAGSIEYPTCDHEFRQESSTAFCGSKCWKCGHILCSQF